MFNHRVFRFFAGAALFMLAAQVQADPIIDNLSSGKDCGVGQCTAVAASTGKYAKAAGFTMGKDSYTLNSVTLRLDIRLDIAHLDDTDFGLTVKLFGDIAGNPGPALLDFVVPTLARGAANYTFTPGKAFALLAGKRYWLVVTGHSSMKNGIRWMASIPSQTPTGVATSAGYRFTKDGTFRSTKFSKIFNSYRVDGTRISVPEPSALAVPEPSALALLGLGLAALGIATGRRRSRQRL